VISQLQAALVEEPLLKVQVVDAMLKQQVACSLGSLVTWVQQQPEQLSDLREVAVAGHQGSAPVPRAVGGTIPSIWAAGVHLIGHFAAAASESTGTCSLAASLTQQLDQSGKPCSCQRKCTAQ
jgi:hypothetical protein